MFKLSNWWNRDLPVWFYDKMSKAPLIGSQKARKDVTRLKQAYQRAGDGVETMKYFTSGHWIYELAAVYEMKKMLSPAEFADFQCDAKNINWQNYIQLYAYGIQKFILRQKDVVSPNLGNAGLIRKNNVMFFTDFRQAIQLREEQIRNIPDDQLGNEVLNNQFV